MFLIIIETPFFFSLKNASFLANILIFFMLMLCDTEISPKDNLNNYLNFVFHTLRTLEIFLFFCEKDISSKLIIVFLIQ